MRLQVAGMLFAVAVLAAACGGGKSGGFVPSPSEQQPSEKTGNVTISLVLPQSSALSQARHPQWISPNTASISIVVTPSGLAALPAVTVEIQPVLSSDCVSVGGTISCTISVQAVVNETNAFTIDALGASGAVLSSATRNVAIGTSAGAQPIAFTLDGVVSSIAITFGDSASIPLNGSVDVTVSGLDASGATIVGSFTQPITVTAGTGLQLQPTAAPTTAAASRVDIAHARPLYAPTPTPVLTATISNSSSGNFVVTFQGAPGFDGTPTTPVQITATAPGVTGTASASVTPISTELNFPIALPSGYVNDGNLALAPNGTLDFVVQNPNTGNGVIGAFNPATASVTVSSALGIGFYPANGAQGLTVDSSGNIWVANEGFESVGGLDCFTAPNAAAVPVAVPTPVSSDVEIEAVSADKAGHVWFTDSGNNDAGVISSQAGCSDIGAASITSMASYDGANGEGPIVGDPASAAGAAWLIAYNSIASPYENILVHVPFSGSPAANVVNTAYDVYGAFSFATDALGNTFSTMDGYSSGGKIAEIPSGSANFANASWFQPGVPPSVTNNLVPDGVAAYGTSAANETIAFTAQNQSVIGIYSPVNPATSFAYFTVPGDCTGITYDATGNLWGFCNDAGQASIVKFVLTSAWNLFYNPDDVADGTVSSLVSIAGGVSGAQYTATCTGQLTCPTGSFAAPRST